MIDIIIGLVLLRALQEAKEMRVKQRKVYQEFAANIPEETVKGWEEMLSAWNADPTKPDPYEEPTSCEPSAIADLPDLALM